MNKALAAGARNWKTTLAGIVGGLLILLAAAQDWLDGDPDTRPDASAVIEAAIGIVVIAWGFVTRDADKSSQDSGIR